MNQTLRLQYVYLSRVAVLHVVENSAYVKTAWQDTDDLNFFENAVRALTTDRLVLYLFRRESQNQLDMSYASGTDPLRVSYGAMLKLYEWTANPSDYEYFAGGGRVVMIGVDLKEKDKWRKMIETSRLAVDNVLELHLDQTGCLDEVCLPMDLTDQEQETLIDAFEDYRRRIRQREILAEIQDKTPQLELRNAYGTPGEAPLGVFTEEAQRHLFSFVRFALRRASDWNGPEIGTDHQIQGLRVRFHKKQTQS